MMKCAFRWRSGGKESAAPLERENSGDLDHGFAPVATCLRSFGARARALPAGDAGGQLEAAPDGVKTGTTKGFAGEETEARRIPIFQDAFTFSAKQTSPPRWRILQARLHLQARSSGQSQGAALTHERSRNHPNCWLYLWSWHGLFTLNVAAKLWLNQWRRRLAA